MSGRGGVPGEEPGGGGGGELDSIKVAVGIESFAEGEAGALVAVEGGGFGAGFRREEKRGTV